MPNRKDRIEQQVSTLYNTPSVRLERGHRKKKSSKYSDWRCSYMQQPHPQEQTFTECKSKVKPPITVQRQRFSHSCQPTEIGKLTAKTSLTADVYYPGKFFLRHQCKSSAYTCWVLHTGTSVYSDSARCTLPFSPSAVLPKAYHPLGYA